MTQLWAAVPFCASVGGLSAHDRYSLIATRTAAVSPARRVAP